MAIFSPVATKNEDLLYFLFRVFVGALFLQHGLQKLGLLEGQFTAEGFMGFIGICELSGGIAILFGLWTRLVAVLGIILLLGAYTTQHFSKGLLPIVNRGELALLYIATFVILFVYGARKWSLERMIIKREVF